MQTVDLLPNLRYAFVGKTRSGKSTLAMLVACRIIPRDPKLANGWQLRWVDTKGDPRDAARLRQWGFDSKRGTRIHIRVPFEENNPEATVEAVNNICYKALRDGGVLLVIDEYRHVVQSTRTASPGLLHVHQRGGGLDVGLIGQTQEPVDIPRQLVSQSSHIVLANLSFPNDIKYAKTIYPQYRPPNLPPSRDKHGFYWGNIDGDGEWTYHPHQAEWDASLLRMPSA
jgi:hypothetical protein